MLTLLKLKVKNSSIMFGFVILVFLAVCYYFYSKPYEFLAPGLQVTADFPSKPVFKNISSKFSNEIGSGSQQYELTKHGVTYVLFITKVKESVRTSLDEGVILNRLYQKTHLLIGKQEEITQPIIFQDHTGLSIFSTSNKQLLFGQMFLTSKFIVGIFVRHNGSVLRQEGRAFIESLTINEANELADVFH